MNIAQVLRQPALSAPDRVALLSPEGAEFTCGRLDAEARRVAAALVTRGVGPGHVVALMAENSPSFVASWFGIVYCGATVLPIPVRSRVPELVTRLKHAKCRMLLSDAACAETARVACESLDAQWRQLATMLGDDGESLSAPHEPLPDQPAMLLYTSGTTAAAKAAMIGHCSLLTHTKALVDHTLGLGPADRILGVLPLTHSYGCRMVMLAALYAGATMVLMRRFSASDSLRVAASQAVSWIPAVPTMYAAWAQQPAGPPVSSLRWCLSAGAPLADDVRDKASNRLGAEIRQGYGLTEATFSSLNAPPAPCLPGSVGQAAWGVSLRVVNDRGTSCASGERGEVWVRGANVMMGYLDAPEATSEVLVDGWVHTGDIGYLDDQSNLYVVDRTRDIVLRGGFTVYPAEVEEVFFAHPEVAEAAVLGRPDSFYGEELVALVVPAAGSRLEVSALKAWVSERLSVDKLPREIVLVDSFPLGPSGKVLKRLLRQQLITGQIPLSVGDKRGGKG